MFPFLELFIAALAVLVVCFAVRRRAGGNEGDAGDLASGFRERLHRLKGTGPYAKKGD